MGDLKIEKVEVVDVRFPTSLEGHGSDAMHTGKPSFLSNRQLRLRQ